jgi:hypothetical protein
VTAEPETGIWTEAPGVSYSGEYVDPPPAKITHDITSRFQVSEYPSLLPSKCVICGSVGGDSRVFIDIGLQIEFYGAVYFCSYCYWEGCRRLGWTDPREVAKLYELTESLTKMVEKIKKDKDVYESALRNLLNNDPTRFNDASLVVPTSVAKDVLDDDGEPGRDVIKPDVGNTPTKPSHSKPRPDDIRKPTGIEYTQ